MKKLYTCLTIFLILGVTHPELWAAPRPHPQPQQDRAKIEERLRTLRNWELMEHFDLSPERAQKIFRILKRFDDRRIDLIRKRHRLLKELRQAVATGRVGSGRDETKLNRLMDELSAASVALARVPDKERRALAEVFSPAEQARYILFVNDFSRDMRRVIAKERGGRRPRHP